MFRHPRWIINASHWRDSFIHTAQPSLMTMADKTFSNEKRRLVSQAKGRVLEVGAGSGETLKYYDKSKLDVIYGVEPDLHVLAKLNGEIVKYDLSGKYEALPFGVDETDRMVAAGVVAGSLDTIVCVLSPFQVQRKLLTIDHVSLFNSDA